jgi:AAA ATPase domain
MTNKQRILKSFSIKKLFGTTDVMIPFEDTAKILIGVNGLGKTQVLNILYYTLSTRFDKLIEYVFDSITIEFGDTSKIIIPKSDILKIFGTSNSSKKVIELIGYQQFLHLRNTLAHSSNWELELHTNPIIRNLSLKHHIPSNLIHKILLESKSPSLFEDWDLPVFLQRQLENIEKHIKKYEMLYFPTYRRVEEDLKTLGYDERKSFNSDIHTDRLIHFGMDDVEKRFTDVTQSIDKLSKDGFAKISSEILSQLVKGLPTIDNNFLHTINQKDIEIILARVGNQITVEDKNRIKDIVSTKKIQVKDHSLLYFLQKLINIYDQQRGLDESIKIFRDICNKYLVNKKLIYDESSIEIYVQSDGNIEQLPLSKLSSGEKQIISIFSKVYLAPADSRFIVFFDEPELSLAIDWQRDLLPDIFNSGKCHFLLAVTHSPFIFENELDIYAIGLNAYLKPSKPLAA